MNAISYEEHQAWFERKLKEERTQIYILCDGALEIGVLRLELEEESVTISYSIASEYRNQGYGKELIRLAEQEVIRLAKDREKER